MSSSSIKGGPLSRWTSASSGTTACGSPTQQSHSTTRQQTWASATWATGQSIITGMLYHHKDSHNTQQQRNEQYYQRLPQQHGIPMPLPLPPPALEKTTQTSSSVRHQPLELPPIPRLLGNENLDEWDDMLIRTLRLHGLDDHVTLPYPGVPEPIEHTPGLTFDQWTRDRSLVCLLIVGSLSADVRDTLLTSGYDPGETNPKVVYDLIRDAIPRASGEDVASYLRELNSISPAEPRFGGSLREYCLRLGYLRRRLYVSEPQPNDNLVLVMAVLGLARDERYEDLSMDLGKELEKGALSWNRLMGDLAGVHGREIKSGREGQPGGWITAAGGLFIAKRTYMIAGGEA
ncbi:hypothetical protein VP1G_00291 [Cytospora mali]|uniref:Uncharacterized protein n=1 Tax=Cytospora mali TaxID=578113 RepID=A0A194UMF2_CYTMA|nr:hypothetical protein VP1G_00291 [Valsa mali var. pyri (nom. inval.)]